MRAGWNETSYRRDEEYLADADYLFGRPPDAIFSKGRSKTTERLEIGLWLAPARVGEKLLWVVQFKHALGRRFAIGDRFLGVPLDPNSTQGRDFVLQDLWYAQSIDRWAWSQSGEIVSAQTPATDLHGNDWFSNDEYRAVIWIAGDPVALGNAEYVVWSRYPGNGGETP
ncbi:MAG: hypothetical protein P8Y54_15300 [Xanthomonadales bacterium]